MTPDHDEICQRLVRFLESHHAGASVRVESYESVLGGFSRITTRARGTIDGQVTNLILRSDPPPDRETAHTDREQEWQIMRSVYRCGTVPLPEPMFYDSGAVLGSPTIIMREVDGQPLLHHVKASDTESGLQLADKLVDLAVNIHRADTAMIDLPAPNSWDDYIDSCIDQWLEVERTHLEPDPFIRYLAKWLDNNRPPPAPLGLVHGDFQTTNVMVTPDGTLVALDWELTHVGDPREDLGWCKWNEVIQPPALMGIDERRFLDNYAERSGLGTDIINSSTVSYFSILSAVAACRLALPSVASFSLGRNDSLVAGYILGYISTFHQQFVEVTAEIDLDHRTQGVSR